MKRLTNFCIAFIEYFSTIQFTHFWSPEEKFTREKYVKEKEFWEMQDTVLFIFHSLLTQFPEPGGEYNLGGQTSGQKEDNIVPSLGL